MISDNELSATRKYLHHVAINWWAKKPESTTSATCDTCGMRSVDRNDGYLIGSNLWCEQCYLEKGIEDQIGNNPERSLGPGVFQRAQEMFGHESRQ